MTFMFTKKREKGIEVKLNCSCNFIVIIDILKNSRQM